MLGHGKCYAAASLPATVLRCVEPLLLCPSNEWSGVEWSIAIIMTWTFRFRFTVASLSILWRLGYVEMF